MTKYIALAMALFSIYLAVRLEDFGMVSLSLLGYLVVIVTFIIDASAKKLSKPVSLDAAFTDDLISSSFRRH
ncbi:hypothetical protein BIT28_24790 [Photobacterium proteolyticum]|uniref:Uncharacterized protein n=1 Tax=Photobacterium proteolyticum TaxID=1903952 RepID=A0A1Q9GCW4_9GAMM|nr:hypothetical protein [Photobacterium proteolyticum]OLQ72237.1 hypothetical protein BIT28_24790 [Photobacterium proteolyticum]